MELLTGGELFDRIIKKGNYTEIEVVFAIIIIEGRNSHREDSASISLPSFHWDNAPRFKARELDSEK